MVRYSDDMDVSTVISSFHTNIIKKVREYFVYLNLALLGL